MKVIAFILAFKEKPYYPLISLSKQSIKPNKIVIVAAYPSACVDQFRGMKIECLVIPPDLSLSVGERVGKSLTIALKKFLTEDYDYMLKLDSDIYFDEKFIEENTRAGYDLMGRGSGMIIKVKSFIETFDHTWPISPLDDLIVTEVFKARGYKVLPWRWAHPAKIVKEPKYDAFRAFRAGYEYYKIGFPILPEMMTTLERVKRREFAFVAHPIGYFLALLRNEKKYPFSKTIHNYYVALLSTRIRNKLFCKSRY
ncbi:MAG: hypothetical protein ACTSX9_09685 [Candidatus Njordarchaeales archaeon]